MIHKSLYFLVTGFYLWLFRELITPPDTWVTAILLIMINISTGIICVVTSWLVNMCKKPVNRDLLCEIHGSLPEYRVFCLVLSMLAMILILIEASHIKTAGACVLAWVCMCVFVWRVLLNPPQTVRCDDDSQRLIYKALKAWDHGDFHRVAVILEQLSIREIEDLTEQIEAQYGAAEAKLISRLIN